MSLLWFPFWGVLEEAEVGRTSLWVLRGAPIPVPPIQETGQMSTVSSNTFTFKHKISN